MVFKQDSMDGVRSALYSDVDRATTGLLLRIEGVARHADILDFFQRRNALRLIQGSHVIGAGTVDADGVGAGVAAIDGNDQSAVGIGSEGIRIGWRRDTRNRDKQHLVITPHW